MLAILNVILPVFAIVALGYGAVRWRLYPAEGVKGLIGFVNNFATPCLLFQAMLNADFSTAFNPAIIIPFYVGALTVFALGIVAARLIWKSRPGESVASAFSATFTNTVLVGIPIMQRAYGEGAMPVVFSIIGFHAPLLITVGMVTMELMRRDGQSVQSALRNAGIRAAQNPLLWGIVAGATLNLLGIGLIEPAEAFVRMMAQAVLPAALFGLGGALNAYRIADNWQEAAIMSGLKLVVHPAIAYVLMVPILNVEHDLARIGVLLAAMPTGINAYVFATYYNRSEDVATNTILISTGASVLSLSLWLWLLN